MDNDRFGPIRPDEKPPKRYRIDYNRLITVLMVLVIIALAVYMVRDYKRKKEQPNIFFGGTVVGTGGEIIVPGVSTPAPRLALRPEAEREGLLPVFYMANTEEKRVAITVDQCMSASEIYKLLEACETYGAKLTFFPTGEEIAANASLWTTVVLGGHEIENHTLSNARLAAMDAEAQKNEITAQTEWLRSIIGEDYAPHFLRTNNLEDDNLDGLHALLQDLGYFGIARWALKTPGSFESVAPGQILAYNGNEAGGQALRSAMRILKENGYEMVTLNDLFDYPENILSAEFAG